MADASMTFPSMPDDESGALGERKIQHSCMRVHGTKVGGQHLLSLEYGTDTLEIHTSTGMAPLRSLQATKYRKAPESAILPMPWAAILLMPWAPVRLRPTRVRDEPES